MVNPVDTIMAPFAALDITNVMTAKTKDSVAIVIP